MTLWNSEDEIRDFMSNGAHLEAMKTSKEIAREIRSITIETDELPGWKEAFQLLKKGKVIKY